VKLLGRQCLLEQRVLEPGKFAAAPIGKACAVVLELRDAQGAARSIEPPLVDRSEAHQWIGNVRFPEVILDANDVTPGHDFSTIGKRGIS